MGNPGFLWMPRDWLASTFKCGLTRSEQAIYFDLLCHAWLDDGLPDDIGVLARVVGESPDAFALIWNRLATHFPVAGDGRRRNPRQERERAEQTRIGKERSIAGQKGNASRWASQTDRKPIATVSQADRNGVANRSPAPAPAPAPTEEKTPLPPKSAPRRRASPVEPPPIPASLDTPEFRAALEGFESSRKGGRHKPQGLRLLFRDLEPYGPAVAVRALEQATVGSWMSVDPSRLPEFKNGHAAKPLTPGPTYRDLDAEFAALSRNGKVAP